MAFGRIVWGNIEEPVVQRSIICIGMLACICVV